MQCKRIIHLNNGTAILNEDIYLGMSDKEVEVLFELEGFSFNDGNLYGMTGAKIIVKKPNGERYNSSFVSLRNDMIVWNVNQELIDELIYNIQKKNNDYKLISKKEDKLTKDEFNGYKLLYENEKEQVMVNLYKKSDKLVSIRYEANNDYFDILLDSVHNIVCEVIATFFNCNIHE